MTTLKIVFDTETLANIAKLENWKIRFNSHVMDGLGRSAEAVHGEATVYSWATFKSPSGEFASSLQDAITSPTTAQVWAEAAYAQRLNYGFSGKTDSLGRTFIEWPAGAYAGGYHWAEASITAATPQVEAIFQAEMETCANGA